MKADKCTKAKYAAGALSLVAVLLIGGSFFVPPTGVIDGSVIAAVGELFMFAALFAAWEAIDRGMDAKFKRGDFEMELNNPDNDEKSEQ